MSDWTPFHLLGKTQLAAVANRVHEVLPALARGWWKGACPVQLAGVTAAVDLRDQLSASPVRYLLRAGDLWLAFLGAEHAWLKLTEGWLDCEITASSTLAKFLQRRFCLELFAGLTGTSAEPAVLGPEDAPRLPPHATRMGYGSPVVELDIHGVPLTCVAPVELWPNITQPSVRLTRKPLLPVSKALDECRIALDVRLPAVKWSVSEAATLAVGDFLDLRQDLSGRVRVTGAGFDFALAAALGQEGGQKAVRLMNDESEPS
jgi:hypothetical protein